MSRLLRDVARLIRWKDAQGTHYRVNYTDGCRETVTRALWCELVRYAQAAGLGHGRHRGAGAGAPHGNQNRRTHGFYSLEEIADLVNLAADDTLDDELAAALGGL